jgi:hypothetical protein
MILAIDPGNIESAYVLIDNNYKPIKFDKINNDELLTIINTIETLDTPIFDVVIEMVASYGKPVGQTVFDTCVWIGRFMQLAIKNHYKVTLIFRKDVKMNLCYSVFKVTDSVICQALKDRFGIVGTKNNQGWFYGFKKDVWQAYALGVTFLDKLKGEIK